MRCAAGNEQVTGPTHLRRAFEFIRDHERFRVSDLPRARLGRPDDSRAPFDILGLLRRTLASMPIEAREPVLA